MKAKILMATAGALLVSTTAMATVSVSTYDDLSEAFYGTSFHYNGVTYNEVNNVSGVFPSGDTFGPGGGVDGLGDQVIVENATLFYNDFPAWGSANNALTFGSAFITGDNLSLGAISTVTMDLDQNADSASLEMAYFENGPWGGIVYHLDALLGGSVVASDSFSISDLGGRDNIALATLSVGGAEFDSLQLYATFGADYSGPRIIMDNLTINSVPAPASAVVLALGGLVAGRRRR
ncbi:MAG: hypothetical protein DHS20C14_04230 [Phycisphaeraceae bacterium]|nr:MAG: hypothetical protein DHS20C14_04230 [Phycisphaeraceae bacterium]